MPLFLRFTNNLEQQAKQYLPAINDFAMKKVFGDHRLWPGVVQHVEFEALDLTVYGIRNALFHADYRMKKTLTKIGSRRGTGVRLHLRIS